MSSFALLSLPHLPLINVLKQMTVQNLIDLSFEQEDIQDFLRMIPIRSGGYTVSLDETDLTIQMNNLSYTFERSDSNKSILLNLFDGAYGYLEKLFPGGINHLEVSPLVFSENFNQLPTECDIFSIGKESEFDENNIDYIEECPDEMINSLIQQTNFKSGLKLNGLMKTENQKMFDVDFLKIYNSGWMTSETLERLQNRIVLLEYSDLYDSEINDFLKNLKNGTGNNRLEVMTIDNENGWDLNLILEGLESTYIEKQIFKMDKKTLKHAEEFLPFHIDLPINLHDAHEFKTIDGRRISVVLTISTLPSSLRIFVWPDESKEKSSRKRGNDEEVNGPSAKKRFV